MGIKKFRYYGIFESLLPLSLQQYLIPIPQNHYSGFSKVADKVRATIRCMVSVIFHMWEDAIDFFLATQFSGWANLKHLEDRYIFNHEIIWITRYFISIPVIFGPLIFIATNIIGIASNEMWVDIITTLGKFGFTVIWFTTNLVIYPFSMLLLYKKFGIIRNR